MEARLAKAADDREDDVALGDALVQHPHEVETRRNIVDVQKQLLRLKNVLQPIKRPPGMPGSSPRR